MVGSHFHSKIGCILSSKLSNLAEQSQNFTDQFLTTNCHKRLVFDIQDFSLELLYLLFYTSLTIIRHVFFIHLQVISQK